MSESIAVFLIVPTNRHRVDLQSTRLGSFCKVDSAPCRGVARIAVVEREHPTSGITQEYLDDPRWPRTCARCGSSLGDDAEPFVNHQRLYRRADGLPGEWPLHEAPPGAMWRARWYEDIFQGPDGKVFEVMLPVGQRFVIDSRASNCTLPHDSTHNCWVRHGDNPPDVHVDKNGRTCSAGAGSILVGGWHGFLHHGHLVTA